MSRTMVCALALLCAAPAVTPAQGRMAIGGRVGYDHLARAMSLGAEVQFPISRTLVIRPSVDLFAMEFGSYRSFNLDLQYAPTRALYVGGGFASRWRTAGDVAGDVLGANLFAGVVIPGGLVRPFAEAGVFLKGGTRGNGRFGISVQLRSRRQ
jgi:hypothetical protein